MNFLVRSVRRMQKINVAYNCKKKKRRKQQKPILEIKVPARSIHNFRIETQHPSFLLQPHSFTPSLTSLPTPPSPNLSIYRCVWPWPCQGPDLSVTLKQLQVKDPAQPLDNEHSSYAGITKFYKMTLIPRKLWWTAWRLPGKEKVLSLSSSSLPV